MTIHLLAPGNRARSLTTVVALALAALLAGWTPARAETPQRAPVLSQGVGMGSTPSVRVRELQRALRQRGYDLGAPGVDGRFGPLTAAAVRRFQARSGLAPDGIVGTRTRRALRLSSPHARPSSWQDRTPRSTTANPARTARPSSALRPVPVSAPANTSREAAAPSTPWLSAIAAGLAGAALITALWALAVGLAHRRRYDEAAEQHRSGRRARTRPVDVPGAAAASPAGDAPTAANAAASRPGAPNAPSELGIYLVERNDPPATPAADEAAKTASGLRPGDRVIGYVTVSADAGTEGITSACEAIEARCVRSRWKLVEIVRDHEHGPALERSGLVYALDRIRRREARALIIADLQRATRSIVDLGGLMEQFRDADAALIALDLDLDTSTDLGRDVRDRLITLAGWQRERIARRTRAGLAEVRATDRPSGRVAISDRPELLERIEAMRAANMTLEAIADQLNAEGVPTPRGGAKWRPSSIQAALGYRRPSRPQWGPYATGGAQK